MNQTITALKSDLKARLDLSREVEADGVALKREGNHMVGLCPLHNESTPSFKINVADQFFKCFGCGASGDIFSWLSFKLFKTTDAKGVQFIDVLREGCRRTGIPFPEEQPKATKNETATQTKPAKKPKRVYETRDDLLKGAEWVASEVQGRITNTYEYCHPSTRIAELIVFRIEKQNGKKDFLQAHPVDGGFVLGGLDRNPLYNRLRVLVSNQIVVVEGEKCVHKLQELGIVATTSPGGADSAAKADWSPLAGKNVTIWPDNDAPGEAYAADVLTALNAVNPPPIINVIEPTALGLGKSEDAVDFIDRLQGDDMAKVAAVAEALVASKAIGPIADLDVEIADTVAGRRYAVPLCWDIVSNSTRALLPGSVAILAGGPGSTKSLSVIQNLLHWKRTGVPACALMLEDGVKYHLWRAMAQIAGRASVTDDRWCKANPREVADIQASTRDELRSLVPYIDEPPRSKLTPTLFLTWLKAKAAGGARVLIVDPITAMSKGALGYNDDQDFMMDAKRIMEDFKCSLFIISHPKKANGFQKPSPLSLGDLAGGAAYERFAHVVTFLSSHDPREVMVDGVMGRLKVTSNRTITVLKARNSYGTGHRIAMWFDSSSLTLRELGTLVKEEE